VFNQTLMAVPMMILYEVGIWILARLEKQRKEQDALAAMEEQSVERSE
jgi:Sec-independent protein secretion pathway component TatC